MKVRMIAVNANACTDNKNGTFTLELPAYEVNPADMRVLENLFPNTMQAVEKLLDQEVLIGCIATPSQVLAPESKKKTSY